MNPNAGGYEQYGGAPGQPGLGAFAGLGGSLQALAAQQAGGYGAGGSPGLAGRPAPGGFSAQAAAAAAAAQQQQQRAAMGGLGALQQQLGAGGYGGRPGGLGGGGAAAFPGGALAHAGAALMARSPSGAAGGAFAGLGSAPPPINPAIEANLAAFRQRAGLPPPVQRLGGYSAPSGDLLSMLAKAGGAGAGRLDEGPAFSAADFPSLGAGPGAARAPSGDGLGALLAGGRPPPPPPAGPAFGEEDFPALPGAAGPPAGAPRAGGEQGAAQLAALQARLGGLALAQQQQAAAAAAQAQQQAAAAAAAAAGFLRPPGAPAAPPPKPAPGGLERFGMLGLLAIIRVAEPGASTLALGLDLTTLGLNLNSPDPLWRAFASPWADAPGAAEPEFRVPACYLGPAPRLSPAHVARLQPDTLFYAFYGMPGDEAQLWAADELAARGWYFHSEMRAWLTRAPGSEPLQKTDRFERGAFFIFDPAAWEVQRREDLVVQFDALERPPGAKGGAGAPAAAQ